MTRFVGLVLAALLLMQWSAMAAQRLVPGQDGDVLEVLTTITRKRPATNTVSPQLADPAAVAIAVRQHVAMARQTGETRYWGRAQAALSPWWNRTDAPADLAILQATVQQGRHEFERAHSVLQAALTRAPQHAQGWLNLAALERLSSRYAKALLACRAVAQAGQTLYAEACRLETLSLRGQHALVEQGLTTLIKQVKGNDHLSWLLSLLAEARERAGLDAQAADAYQRSLTHQPDLYTSIAYSDLLLRTGQLPSALETLAKLPDTDAVVLRRAAAWKRLGDARWVSARALLQDRVTELVRRGDDPALHGRELALAALWLDDDASAALALARTNLLLQREPLDWWVAMQSARAAGNTVALLEIQAAVRACGLKDERLAPPPLVRRVSK